MIIFHLVIAATIGLLIAGTYFLLRRQEDDNEDSTKMVAIVIKGNEGIIYEYDGNPCDDLRKEFHENPSRFSNLQDKNEKEDEFTEEIPNKICQCKQNPEKNKARNNEKYKQFAKQIREDHSSTRAEQSPKKSQDRPQGFKSYINGESAVHIYASEMSNSSDSIVSEMMKTASKMLETDDEDEMKNIFENSAKTCSQKKIKSKVHFHRDNTKDKYVDESTQCFSRSKNLKSNDTEMCMCDNEENSRRKRNENKSVQAVPITVELREKCKDGWTKISKVHLKGVDAATSQKSIKAKGTITQTEPITITIKKSMNDQHTNTSLPRKHSVHTSTIKIDITEKNAQTEQRCPAKRHTGMQHKNNSVDASTSFMKMSIKNSHSKKDKITLEADIQSNEESEVDEKDMSERDKLVKAVMSELQNLRTLIHDNELESLDSEPKSVTDATLSTAVIGAIKDVQKKLRTIINDLSEEITEISPNKCREQLNTSQSVPSFKSNDETFDERKRLDESQLSTSAKKASSHVSVDVVDKKNTPYKYNIYVKVHDSNGNKMEKTFAKQTTTVKRNPMLANRPVQYNSNNTNHNLNRPPRCTCGPGCLAPRPAIPSSGQPCNARTCPKRNAHR